MHGLHKRNMAVEGRAPLIVEPSSASQSHVDLIRQHSEALKSLLLEHGALLFRGFPVASVADFDEFVAALSLPRLDYVYRSTPRTSVGSRIFTTTEYPAALEIPLHNENAYQREWPLKIAFCCLTPAASGGETPIADMRRVTAAIGDRLLDRFAERQVRYVRHYRPFMDVPWQTVFQTEDKREVSRFCAEHDISHQWLDDKTLRTVQVCQGVAAHPATQERIFFNQAHLFHVSNLGSANAQSLIKMFGADRLPRQAFYGDGKDIEAEDLEVIRAAFQREALIFPWQSGDVMLLDNMQFAHGRRPFSGIRKVVAALLESHLGTKQS